MSLNNGDRIKRLAQERYDQVLRDSRETAREQRAEALRQAGFVHASDIGLAEVERRLVERSRSEREAHAQLQELQRLLTEEERRWRGRVEARRQAAHESMNSTALMIDLRDDVGCVAEVRRRLGAWFELQKSGNFQPIDDLYLWRPCDFFVLRITLRQEGGGEAYQNSMHWKITREAQRVLEPLCERCGAGRPFQIHAHHLHYDTLGVERPGIDLVSLCEACHLDGEHREFSAARLAQGPTPDRISF